MKIRIQGNSIRLRLSQKEVDEVGCGKSVVENVEIGQGILTYELRPDPSSKHISGTLNQQRIVISMPPKQAEKWANSNDVGVEHIDFNTRIFIEKDFQCLTDRPKEDESDLFPNPNLAC